MTYQGHHACVCGTSGAWLWVPGSGLLRPPHSAELKHPCPLQNSALPRRHRSRSLPASDLLLAALPGGAHALMLLLGAQTRVISLPSVLIEPYFGSHFLRISLC